jgi:hypothetical protein
MQRTSELVLPYDPAARAHHEAEERRHETQLWLEQQRKDQKSIDSPPAAPQVSSKSR